MTRKFIFYSVFLVMTMFVMGCSSDEMIELEDTNAYPWQKYMNEEEFQQLETGMTYEEVAQIAKGAGEKVEGNIYRWSDEQLMTQVYELEFKEDKLVEKEIVKIYGSSKRYVLEKAPATSDDSILDMNNESDSK